MWVIVPRHPPCPPGIRDHYCVNLFILAATNPFAWVPLLTLNLNTFVTSWKYTIIQGVMTLLLWHLRTCFPHPSACCLILEFAWFPTCITSTGVIAPWPPSCPAGIKDSHVVNIFMLVSNNPLVWVLLLTINLNTYVTSWKCTIRGVIALLLWYLSTCFQSVWLRICLFANSCHFHRSSPYPAGIRAKLTVSTFSRSHYLISAAYYI